MKRLLLALGLIEKHPAGQVTDLERLADPRPSVAIDRSLPWESVDQLRRDMVRHG